MAKLSKDDWLRLQEKWEADERQGFDWLVSENLGVVSRQAISKYAKKHGWTKNKDKKEVAQPKIEEKKPGKTIGNEDKKVAQPKQEKSCATNGEKVAQPNTKNSSRPRNKILPFIDKKKKYLTQEVASEIIRPNGRPLEYRVEFDEMAYRLCLLGLGIDGIAALLCVNHDTIYSWIKEYPSFSDAINNGRVIADSVVAASLYKRATGFEVQETKLFKTSDDRIIGEDITRYHPPDVGAQKMWLCNRQPELWRNNVVVDIPQEYPEIPKEELDRIHAENLERQKKRMQETLGRAQRLGIASYIETEVVTTDE